MDTQKDNGIKTIESCYDDVLRETRYLTAALPESGAAIRTFPETGGEELVSDSLTDFWYRDGMDGRATVSYFGTVGSSDEILSRVRKINQFKSAFAALIKEIRARNPKQVDEYKVRLFHRDPGLHEKLRTQGFSRLNIKQLTRQIPVLDKEPAKIAFSWYKSGRSIQKISRQEALERLENFNLDNPHIRIQYDRLSSLPATEPLALVQQLAPIMRANVLFSDGERTAFNCSLPVFYPFSGTLPLLRLPAPQPPEQRTRKRRSDNRIEDDPVAESIRVYRYSRTEG